MILITDSGCCCSVSWFDLTTVAGDMFDYKASSLLAYDDDPNPPDKRGGRAAVRGESGIPAETIKLIGEITNDKN